MGKLLHKAFGIHSGEGKNVLRFIRLGTLWAFGAALFETLSISLFLENVGPEKLPFAYLITSSIFICLSAFFIYLLRVTTPYKIFKYSLIAGFIIFFTISFLINFSFDSWFWFFLHIFGYIFMAAFIAIYWTFVSQYHDMQEAKRVYGIYNASYFLGYVFSGTTINLLYKHIGPDGLLKLSSFLLLLSIIEIYFINKKVPSLEEDLSEDFFSGGKKGIKKIFFTFFKSKYAIILVCTSLVIQLLRTTTEFSYMETFSNVFGQIKTNVTSITKNSELCEFIAKCKAYISFFNIILGMFFYGRLVRKISLANMLLLPPLFFLMLYLKWSFTKSLMVAVLGIISVEGILYTIEDNNFNLLINALPSKLQGILRIINDSLFEPLGMLLGSFFLILFKSHNIILGSTLTLIFLLFTHIIRKIYPKAILDNIKENAVHFDKGINHWIEKLNIKEKKEYFKSTLKHLNDPNENCRLLALETLLIIADKNNKIISTIIPFVQSLSENGKRKAFQMLEKTIYFNEPQVIDLLYKYEKQSNDITLKKYCLLALAKQGLLPLKKTKELLNSKDPFLRSIAIINQIKIKEPQSTDIQKINELIIKKEINLLFSSPKADDIIIGLEILLQKKSTKNLQQLIKLLQHEDISVKIKAAQILSINIDTSLKKYVPQILSAIKQTRNSTFRIYCLKFIENIAHISFLKDLIIQTNFLLTKEIKQLENIIFKIGFKSRIIILSILRNTKINDKARLLAGKLLFKTNQPEQNKIFDKIIQMEIKKAYFYYYMKNILHKKYSLYDLKLLENILHKKYFSSIDFLINLISAKSSSEDYNLIIHALYSQNAKVKANAIETLEKYVDKKIMKMIHPLLDEYPLESIKKYYIKFIGSLPNTNLNDILENLEKNASPLDKSMIKMVKIKLKNTPLLETSNNDKIKLPSKHLLKKA